MRLAVYNDLNKAPLQEGIWGVAASKGKAAVGSAISKIEGKLTKSPNPTEAQKP
ncbi:MAG: hypothetical protein FWD50_01135 [Betaproteobacteria bacterium]|nr:hypothetical protein [Betaproteobacteria bacterium]